MKVSINGYIHAERLGSGFVYAGPGIVDKHRFTFFVFENMKPNWVMVCPYTIEFDLPQSWNPIPQELAILKKARDEFSDEAFKKLSAMDIEISKLLSLECDVKA